MNNFKLCISGSYCLVYIALLFSTRKEFVSKLKSSLLILKKQIKATKDTNSHYGNTKVHYHNTRIIQNRQI